MLDPKLMEAIDVCRPGSRDVEQPELTALAESLKSDPQVRAVYETVQRLDTRLASTMYEVPVPTGLAGRILECLAASAESGGAAAMAVAATTSAAPDGNGAASTAELNVPSSVAIQPAAIQSAGRFTRRRIQAGVGLAACLLLAVGWAVLGRQAATTQVGVTERAVVWYEQLGDPWQPVAKAPKGFSVPKGIGGTVRGWQWLAKAAASSGVAFDLGQDPPGQNQPGRGPRAGAVLFVIKAARPDLPSSAPRTPQSTTAGFAIGAWQSGGLMYVLVVPGDEQAYQKLLHPVRPLA